MVRYKVKAAESERNEDLVRQVYEELHQSAPAGLRYATFALEDGLSFVHVASFDDDRNPLTDVAAFHAFQENMGDRLDEQPRVENLREIGSYGVFAREREAVTN